MTRVYKNFMYAIENRCMFKLNGKGLLLFHLWCDYSMSVIVFYDFNQTNTSARWFRQMLLCLVKIQNLTVAKGQMNHVKRIYTYLDKMRNSYI